MLVLFLVLGVIALAAPRYGVDSRSPVSPLRRRTPAADLAALWRRLVGLRGPRIGPAPGDPADSSARGGRAEYQDVRVRSGAAPRVAGAEVSGPGAPDRSGDA